MSAHPAKDRARPDRFTTAVINKIELSARYYLVVLKRPEGFPDPGAGTFIHLLLPDQGRFFLRRPFSILDCDEKTLSLLIVEKGTGTQLLRRISLGGELDFIGPLGSVFPEMPGKRVLAIGGGVGLAPLYFYGATLSKAMCDEYRLIYGARSREDLFVDSFDWRVDGMKFSTDDGSYGFKGNVAALAAKEMDASPVDVVFSCGPTPMLKAVAELARSKRISHYVSLENRMACGVGACRSCVVLWKGGGAEEYKTVCNDGPVFDADDLVWDKLPEI